MPIISDLTETAGNDDARFPLFSLAQIRTGDDEQQPPSPPPTAPAPDRYAALITKYIAIAARSSGKNKKHYTEPLLRDLIKRAETAIETLNYESLRSLRFRDLNPFSREVFTLITGIQLPRLQVECLKVVEEFVGPERVAAYHAAKQQARTERDFGYLSQRLANRRVKFEKQQMSMKEFIDLIISRGYRILGESKRGAAPEYRLSTVDRCFFVLRRRDERDYAEMRLAQLDQATAAAPSEGAAGGEGQGDKGD
jgi:hypothetical protein